MGFYDNQLGQEEQPYSEEEMRQQAPVPPQSQQYDRIIQEEKVANFISQTSPTRTLVKVDFILKGYVFDEGEKKWVKVSQSIPDKIRLDFLQIMTPHLSEDVRMGRLDMNQINKIMEFIIEWTVDYLKIVADDYSYDVATGEYKNRNTSKDNKESMLVYNFDTDMFVKPTREKEIKNKPLSEEQMTKIAMLMWSAVFHTLSRAMNGVERDRMYNSLKLGDNFGEYAKQEEKKSLLDAILPWK